MKLSIKIIKNNWREIFLFTLLILVGSFLRFYHYNYLSFWYDELFAVTVSSKSFPELFREMFVETNPPLYQFLLFLWIKVFGNLPESVRAFSVLISIFTLPIIFLFSLRLWNKRKSFSLLLLLTLSSGSILYAQEVRAYSLLILLSGISYLLWLGILKSRNSSSDFLIFFFISFLNAYTHYFGFFLTNFLWFYLIICHLNDRKKIKLILIFWILLNAGYIPELYKIIFIFPGLNNINWVPKPDVSIYIHFFSYLLFLASFKKIPVFLIFIVILILPLYDFFKESRWRIEKNDFRTFLRSEVVATLMLIISLLVGTNLISQVKPVLTSRNLLILMIPSYTLFVIWIETASSLKGLHRQILIFLIGILSVLSFSNYYYKSFLKEPWREVTQTASQLIKEDGRVFTFQRADFLDYYLVDVYRSKPTLRIDSMAPSLKPLYLQAKQEGTKSLVFIETPWDEKNMTLYENQKERLKELTVLSKSWEIIPYLTMKVYHFKLE